ncbi:DUF1765-domain-containing protein [Polyplosphaeria fusca]|uniref:DUF1765-domain-containing protein n=1 Tax=Polyplosphaeria fusca TaxID=682080 RepID=A0A9P4V1X9_9PLEO|nr:DUF1765-domain-containing protein [Polyplosphaeria fusca]
MLAHASRGRNRSASEAFPPPERDVEPVHIPKAASYTYFPKVQNLELTGTISEDELKERGSSYSSSNGSSPSSEEAPEVEQLPQLRPSISRRSSRFLPFSSKSREPSAERKSEQSRHEKVKKADSPSVSPVRSLSKLRRKSWITTQPRDESPSKEASEAKTNGARKSVSGAESSKYRSLSGALGIPEKAKIKDVTADSPAPKARVLTKKPKRPLSGIFSSSTAPAALPEPEKTHPQRHSTNIPPVPALPTSFSTEKLPSFLQSPTSPTHIPPLPRNISSEKLKGGRTEPRKKDELWTVFRTLEADLRKFQAKSIALKANVVRTTLLPFLRSYNVHPSNHKLRPEDLDRRANILNGWWTGLLEFLAGRNNQSMSGTDRPAILEGIAGIMERPEWRSSPSPFCALADRVETSSTSTANTNASASSTSSDFLAESVYHNVRNIFIQNLLSQMTFVVDKMALRNAAASLVTFCGKTCAYAFCFCPGVADVLVRLWNPSLGLMKRVLEESDISRQDRLDDVAERISQSFPPLLHSLKFQSPGKLMRVLRRPAALPLGTANLDWNGSWTKRWSGAESDLFYVFVKHYHILVTDFLPIEPSHAERVCVPGLVMVHAQILSNLDATINRHANPQQQDDTMAGASNITFDDVLSDPDASASAIPMPPANATRQMAENRLIMLIRDFLSERNAPLSTARRIFAESFGRLLKAAARNVPIYDNNACHTLCDFLEEAFVILVRYEQLDTQHHSVLDWPFWLLVCKQMAASQNTATEIKLFAFLYSTWSIVVPDAERKRALCIDFLLEPEFFESRFNHWCPMVRAYFMRLLCWRVARYDGEETVGEINIMRALSDRLRSVWSHYLWLREEAEINELVLPSTAACNPAPSRRFLIIRNDNPMATSNGPFLSFDGVIQSPTLRRLPSMESVPEADARPVSAASMESLDFPEEDTTKGRWGILRNIIGTSKQAAKSKSTASARKENSKGSSASPKNSSESLAVKRATPAPVPPPQPTHRSYSFRFALEWVDKRFATFQNMRLNPPRLPLPAQVLLQTKGINISAVSSTRPIGASATSSRYAGRALAEWTFISHECQNFFDRRKNEGVPNNKLVETPTLAVEAFRRPG